MLAKRQVFDVGLTFQVLYSNTRKIRSLHFGSTDRMSAGNWFDEVAPAILAITSKDEAIAFARESTRLATREGADV